jgi:putative phosphoribosyl transferase
MGWNTMDAEREVHVEIPGARLIGDLDVPRGAIGVVLFAHGSGSSRKSSRNRAVARSLEEAGLATLLLDLLTRPEEQREEAGAMLRFDVVLLAERLGAAIDWLGREPSTRNLPIGLFGASTGAAAALIAAAQRPDRVRAVVSRGGRPDLAQDALERVQSPTLLIVGGADEEVLGLNRTALERMSCEKHLVVVRGATHLFQEPGALQEVARLARGWFVHHLQSDGDATSKSRHEASA